MGKLLTGCLWLFLGIGAAVIVAYGANPDLGRYSHGIDWIVLTRRLQWPLVAVSIASCLTLIASVVAARRRVWWLLGLAPVVALFAQRFSFAEQNFFTVADVSHDSMLRAEEVTFLPDDDWVVGIVFDGIPFAYPYRALYSTPVVVHSEREKRMVLIWSPFANHARALTVGRELKARDLDVVSMPCNATLVYNARLGEFINGVTGRTHRDEPPRDVVGSLPATRTTWARWRQDHPDTLVMPPMGRVTTRAPGAPVLPHYPMPVPQNPSVDPNTRVAIVLTTQPCAVVSDPLTLEPLNLMSGTTPVLLFRSPSTGLLAAFDRRIDEDLMPRFALAPRRGKDGIFVDSDTGSLWNAQGVAVEGEMARRGLRLRRIPVEDGLYWGVMQFWNPVLQLTGKRD